jgi:Beta-ketoacyl synthase, N-terminal domain
MKSRSGRTRIAVVGSAFRMPGTEGDGFWEALMAGKDLVSSVESALWEIMSFAVPVDCYPRGLQGRLDPAAEGVKFAVAIGAIALRYRMRDPACAFGRANRAAVALSTGKHPCLPLYIETFYRAHANNQLDGRARRDR